MSIIKEKIKFNNTDMNIKLPISVNDNYLGLQKEINSYVEEQSKKVINDIVDYEKIRFKYKSLVPEKRFNFYFYNGSNYNSNYLYTSFTQEEINYNYDVYTNSFYILDLFDSFNPNTQSKITSQYFTKLSNNNIVDNPQYSSYILSESFQYYYLQLPQYFLTNNIITGYTRFSFYNAKTGKISIFYNEDNESFTTNEKMFFKTIIDVNNKTWYFDTSAMIDNDIINAKELISSQQYIDRFNNTFEDFSNLKPAISVNQIFDYTTGTYRSIV